MRSLSSSMNFLGSAIGLHVGETGGAYAEGQRPQQACIKRRIQRVALQQENECTGRHGVQSDIAPMLHRSTVPRPGRSPRVIKLHVVSFSVVGPPMGAEN